MNRVAVDGQRCLHHGLAQRRMRVDVAPELPGVALEQLCERRLCDELGGAGADYVRAQHLACLGVGDDLDKAPSLAVDLGAPDRREGNLADLDLAARVACLLLGHPDRRYLRMRV